MDVQKCAQLINVDLFLKDVIRKHNISTSSKSNLPRTGKNNEITVPYDDGIDAEKEEVYWIIRGIRKDFRGQAGPLRLSCFGSVGWFIVEENICFGL